jgi:hypothetical protein
MHFPSFAGKCRTTENRISWNFTGPVGPRAPIGPVAPQGAAGAAGATGPPGPAGYISVDDVKDQYLGVLLEDTDAVSVSIYIPSIKKTARLVQTSQNPSKADMYPIPTGYQRDNCTGQPLVDTRAYLYANHIFKVGSKYYTGALPGTGQVVIQSMLALNGTCQSMGGTWWTYPLTKLTADQIPFTLPVSLPLQLDNN